MALNGENRVNLPGIQAARGLTEETSFVPYFFQDFN